jgi:hypothetical protein
MEAVDAVVRDVADKAVRLHADAVAAAADAAAAQDGAAKLQVANYFAERATTFSNELERTYGLWCAERAAETRENTAAVARSRIENAA